MIAHLDERPWTVPVGIFVLTCAVTFAVPHVFGAPISFTNSPVRQQVYSSLTGTSSSLLGFLIAAVTILAAFGKRPTASPTEVARENRLAAARTKLVILLLVTALFMLVILIAACVALALSNQPDRLVVPDGLILAASCAGAVGLIFGGIGLGLAVAERGR